MDPVQGTVSRCTPRTTHIELGSRMLHGKSRLPLTIKYIGPLPPLSSFPSPLPSSSSTAGPSTLSPAAQSKLWLGIEYDDATRGKHSGTYEGIQVFETIKPGAGAFIKKTEGAVVPGLAFVEAIEDRYGQLLAATSVPAGDRGSQGHGGSVSFSDPTTTHSRSGLDVNKDRNSNGSVAGVAGSDAVNLGVSGIVVEAPNMDMVRQRIGTLERIKEMGLDGMWVATMGGTAGQREAVKRRLKGVKTLDMSRNLLSRWSDVAEIVEHLEGLRTLHLNGSRISPPTHSDAVEFALHRKFGDILTLHLDDAGLSFLEVRLVASMFPDLEELHVNKNPLYGSPATSGSGRDGSETEGEEIPWPMKLRSLSMARTEVKGWEEVVSSAIQIPTLQHLDLSFCTITSIPFPPNPNPQYPTTSATSNLHVISNLTSISFAPASSTTWADVAALESWTFGKLNRVRLFHLPGSDRDQDDKGAQKQVKGEFTSELDMSGDAKLDRPGVIARLSGVKMLNSTPVTDVERRDAEVSYITHAERLGITQSTREWARYDELVAVHGCRGVERTGVGVKPARVPAASSLGSKMIDLHIHCSTTEGGSEILTLRLLPASKVSALRRKLERRAGRSLGSPGSLWTTRPASPSVVGGAEEGWEKISEMEDGDEVGRWVSSGDHILFE